MKYSDSELPKTVNRVGLSKQKIMKKFNLFLCAFLLLLLNSFAYSQSSSDFLNQNKMTSSQEFIDNGYIKIGFAFRHHGNGRCICPNCVCSGCKCPIGICICINLRPVSLPDNQDLTTEQINNGYGEAWIKMSNSADIMHIIFLSTNDDNGICPVDSNPYVDQTDASVFGATSPFSISNGNYTVYKTKYTYGEVIVNVGN